MKHYDYLIVGAGLFGSVAARELTDAGKRCLVIDRRAQVGGNLYCEDVEGIHVHKYGAHIFHTDNREVWEYVNRLAEFNRYTNSPLADFRGKLYHMPFNMNTFYAMWGVKTPAEAQEEIRRQIAAEHLVGEPKNLEEKALSLVGRDIYEPLVKGYTEKQWGKRATELPAFIISRLPLRFTFDDNYFNHRFQGIPIGGYNILFDKLLAGIDVELNCDFFADRARLEGTADRILYTGVLDRWFDYCYGELEYRSLRFETEVLNEENHQGVAVVNYTAAEVPYTRVIEHKHFEGAKCQKTVLTREYPKTYIRGDEPYYPVNDERNNALYARYAALAAEDQKLILGGRLGLYKYYDMDKTVECALSLAKALK